MLNHFPVRRGSIVGSVLLPYTAGGILFLAMSRHRRRFKLDELLADHDRAEELEAIFAEIERAKTLAMRFSFSPKVKTPQQLRSQPAEECRGSGQPSPVCG
jgi:hypothetical protein